MKLRLGGVGKRAKHCVNGLRCYYKMGPTYKVLKWALRQRHKNFKELLPSRINAELQWKVEGPSKIDKRYLKSGAKKKTGRPKVTCWVKAMELLY